MSEIKFENYVSHKFYICNIINYWSNTSHVTFSFKIVVTPFIAIILLKNLYRLYASRRTLLFFGVFLCTCVRYHLTTSFNKKPKEMTIRRLIIGLLE